MISDQRVADIVTTTIARATGVRTVSLGPTAAQPTSLVTILPPPLGSFETRSMATPDIYDVVLRGKACFLVRRSTGIAYEILGVPCSPAPVPKSK